MSWITTPIRAAAVLLVIALAGCVTAPGYRYVVDVGGDYYYDERPALASSVHILPAYGAFGYGWPGGWYGSVGFGFGTYYGLGGYYGPSWGAFGPRYAHAGYWRPPYYYTPRYARPPHYYRPPYRHVRPLPWHDSGNAWQQQPGRWNRPPPGNRPPWRGRDNAVVDSPRPARPNPQGRPSARPLPERRIRVGAPPPGHEPARDISIQPAPGAPVQRVRHAIAPPRREAITPPPGQSVRADNRGGRITAADGAPQRRGIAPAPPRRTAVPASQPRPMAQPRPAAVVPRPAPQARPAPMPSRAPMPAARPSPMRSAPPPAPAPRGGGPSRRGGGPQRAH